MSDEFRFMGKEVVVSDNLPEGEMLVVENKFMMQKEQLEKLKEEFAKMSLSTSTATLGLDKYCEAINDAASTMSQHNWGAGSTTTAGTYTVSTDGTYVGNGTWDAGATTWTDAKLPTQVYQCELCNEDLEEPYPGGYRARMCELCHAAVMKIRIELFTDLEAVYVDDINQLLEET